MAAGFAGIELARDRTQFGDLAGAHLSRRFVGSPPLEAQPDFVHLSQKVRAAMCVGWAPASTLTRRA